MINRKSWIFVMFFALSSPIFAEDSEDFEVQEEGIFFDYPRTGLFFPRNDYINGENITNVPYFPTYYNDTRDTGPSKIYIAKWEQDPPSFITLYVQDDRPYQYSKAEIDLRVTIGHYDRAKNMVPASQVVFRDIPVQNGLNRIPLNIHNYKGDVVSIRMIGVRQKIPIEAIDAVED